MCKHQFSHQSAAPVSLESGCGRSVFVSVQAAAALSRPPPCLTPLLCCMGLLWGLEGYWQQSMGRRWQFSSCTLRFNPFWLLWLKVAQTGDYTSVTAGEEVTHHTVQIRLNKRSLGCVDMEICLSKPSLGWIRRLKSAVWNSSGAATVNGSNKHKRAYYKMLACLWRLWRWLCFLSGSLGSEPSAGLVLASGEDTELMRGSWSKNLFTKYEELLST